jgi:potassium-dependent mechanosensitive channel
MYCHKRLAYWYYDEMIEFVELPFLTEPASIGPVTLPFSILEFVTQLVLPVLAAWLVLFVLYRVVRRWVRRVQLEDFNAPKVLKWTRRIFRLGLVFLGVILAGRLLGTELVYWTGTFIRVLSQPFFTSGSTEISVVTVVLVFPVFYLAGWLSKLSRQVVERNVLARLQLDRARQFSVLNVVRFLVMGLTIIVGLSIIGINLSSLAVLFGVLGIGVGFGLQDVIGNMFAGVVIIFARPVKEGDRILVDEIEGTVQQIKLIHTVVETVTHETIIIPNSRITGSTMHNYSYDDIRIVVCNSVQVSYESDLDRVGEVLLALARRNPYAAPHEEPRYRVWSFDDSGITVRICTWIDDAVNRVPAFSWTNLEIWRAFRDNGIVIPFPQMDLHVKDTPGTTPKPDAGPEGEDQAEMSPPARNR